MILSKVIRYTNAPAIEATWVENIQLPQQEIGHGVADAVLRTQEVVVKCRVYSNHPEQMQQLRTDLGPDAPQYEEMIQQCIADYIPPPPPSIEEQNAQILFEISSLERQYLMPRITREATILQLETWALSQGYSLDQFRLANKGYRGLKELDERIIYLRGQLK